MLFADVSFNFAVLSLFAMSIIAKDNTCSKFCEFDPVHTETHFILGANIAISNMCGLKLQCSSLINYSDIYSVINSTFPNLCVINCTLNNESLSFMQEKINNSALYVSNLTDSIVLQDICVAPTLKLINITKTPIKLVQRNGNFSTETLEISFTKIGVLPPKGFLGLSSLHFLRLIHNKIVNISNTTFEGLSALEKLDLSYNSIVNLTSDTFTRLENLKELNLDYNKIKKLPTNIFDSLSSVSLNYNNLQKIDMSSFDRDHITRLSLAGNNLTLGGNIQSSLAGLVNLRHLNLSHNRIDTVYSDFRFILNALENLDLSYNRIRSLQGHDAKFEQHNIIVNLSQNNISVISFNLVETETNEIQILLEDNPLNCSCTLYNFTARLQRGFKQFQITNPVCRTPKELSGKSLRNISLSVFVCNITGASCPESCKCIYQPYTNQKQLTCDNVTTLPTNLTKHQYKNKIITLSLTRPPASLASLPDYVKVVNLTGLKLTSVPSLPKNTSLTSLDLSNNSLTYIPKILLQVGLKLRVSSNKFECDCSKIEHLELLEQYSDQIADYRELKCRTVENCRECEELNVTNWKMRCSSNWIIIAGCFVGTFGLLVMFISILYKRYKKQIKMTFYKLGCCAGKTDFDQDKIYDAFICFSHRDAQLVAFELVPGLEKKPFNYKLCLHYRDWIPGVLITTQIVNSILQSRRTIVVLSNNFLNSEWAKYEFRIAYAFAMREGRARIIVILLDNVANDERLDQELRAYLSNFTYIEWKDQWLWNKLRYALPHKQRRRRRKRRMNSKREES